MGGILTKFFNESDTPARHAVSDAAMENQVIDFMSQSFREFSTATQIVLSITEMVISYLLDDLAQVPKLPGTNESHNYSCRRGSYVWADETEETEVSASLHLNSCLVALDRLHVWSHKLGPRKILRIG